MATAPLTKTDQLPYLPGPTSTGPRPLADILADLRKPIHPDITKTKTKGGTTLTFIPWYYAVRILDKYCPGWQSEVTAIMATPPPPAPWTPIEPGDKPPAPIGVQAIVCVRLGIPTSDYGIVWRGSSSQDEDTTSGYGEASERAEGAAFRRAASKFGLGLYWYEKK